MGSPKVARVDIQDIFLRLDGLDGVSDQNYYGIGLAGGGTALGLCAQAPSRQKTASLYNAEGALVEVDCKALAAKLDQLVKISEKNPATPLFYKQSVPANGPITDEELKLYALVDGLLKALLLGSKTSAEISTDKLLADATAVSISWEKLP